MIKSFFIIAYRHLKKDKWHVAMNGFGLSVGLAYYFMRGWLESFAYRIALDPWVFLLASVSGLIIALATVGLKSVASALANPVDSLRNE